MANTVPLLTKPLLTDTQAYINWLSQQVNLNQQAADTGWINSCLYLIFFMQMGFNLLEIGSARHKTYIYTLVKNLLNACTVSLTFWLVGYAFAFGESSNSGIGTTYFGLKGFVDHHDYNHWMIVWAFSVTCFAITSGITLERVNAWVNILHAILIAGFVFPLGVHWAWNEKGWLKELGYIDFAGCGTIHMVGAASGIGALLAVGKRTNKTDEDEDFKGSNLPFLGLATILLWYCWYGFNAGSLEKVVHDGTTDYSLLVGLVGLNSTIGAATGGLVCFFITYFINRKNPNAEEYSMGALCNGILSGLVSVGGCVNNTEPWCCFLMGLLAGVIYIGYSFLSKKLKFDDPLDAIPIHFGVGTWGVIAVGWFDKDHGILFDKGGKQFGIQLLGVVVFLAWALVMSYLFFTLLKICKIHRVSETTEELGFDLTYCGSLAYYYDEVSAREYANYFFGKLGLEKGIKGNEEDEYKHNVILTTDRNNDNNKLMTDRILTEIDNKDRIVTVENRINSIDNNHKVNMDKSKVDNSGMIKEEDLIN